MRILALITEAFGCDGGVAKFNRDLLLALLSHKARPEIIAVPRRESPSAERLPTRLFWRSDCAGSKAWYLARVGCLAIKARQSTRLSHGFDLIVCGHINLLPAACLARWITNRPRPVPAIPATSDPAYRNCSNPALRPGLVLTLHGIEAWQRPRYPFKRWCLGGVDAAIAVSRLTYERFCGWSGFAPKPGLILPNSVDLSEFCPGRKSDLLLDRYGLRGKSVVLTLARLHSAERYKGIDEVLALMPRLRQRGICYLVAGEGEDRPRLTGKARSLGLSVLELDRSRPACRQVCSPDVVFTGYVPEEEKPDHYRLADAFVMPGTGEGFGIVYLEALASGIPVVGSRADAGREVLEGCSSAFLVDPSNPEEIEGAILQALSYPRGLVPERVNAFSRPNFIRRTHEILDWISCTWSRSKI